MGQYLNVCALAPLAPQSLHVNADNTGHTTWPKAFLNRCSTSSSPLVAQNTQRTLSFFRPPLLGHFLHDGSPHFFLDDLCLPEDSTETGFGSKGESRPVARNSARASSTLFVGTMSASDIMIVMAGGSGWHVVAEGLPTEDSLPKFPGWQNDRERAMPPLESSLLGLLA